ncbi:MAG: hypothetical protein IJ231_02505, partial [Clostridia bacterium]|nr:hypothetical protein [Clostridia bacterium]
MKMNAALRKLLAGLMACLMLAAVAASGPARAEEDELTFISLFLEDQVWQAVPVEGLENVYWVMVPAEMLESLSLRIFNQDHAYVYEPADGSLLEGLMDAGTTLEGPSLMITATEGEDVVFFQLYVSTQAVYPVMEEMTLPEITEEPTPEPTEAPTAEPTVTPEPTEAPTAEPTATPEPTEAPTAEPTATP